MRRVRGPAIALSLHELVTNAAKYGELSVASGRIKIAWGMRGFSPIAGYAIK